MRLRSRVTVFACGFGLLTFFGLMALAVPRASFAQRAGEGGPTYRVILFLAEDGAPRDIELRRLEQVWSEGDSPARLQSLLAASNIRRLDAVTILPGQETPAIRVGDVTVRIRGVLQEPRRESMFLRVEVDGGRQALVKEMISGFDETIVLAYPLTEGNRSIVALIVPTNLQR
ncbi:MAG TPA: hypothetical protein VM737_03015 [Gemmatimonadota bacterium]|nr:hypothetical protein [Gemmatimonadota bacterium]